MLNSQNTFDPLRAKSTVSLIKGKSGNTFFTGSAPLAKVSSCLVSPLALSIVFIAFSRYAVMLSSLLFILARSILLSIPPSRLLKSWAIPPARVPRDSSFWLF